MKETNKITFSHEEEELFHRLEKDDSLGTWIISPHATPLEKAKYSICQAIIRYQIRNNLSEKEMAKRLKLDELVTSKLLRCRIDNFGLNELTIYLGRVWASELVDSKGEVDSSISSFIELTGGEKATLGKKTIEKLEKMCNPIQEKSDFGLLEWINQKKSQYNSIVFRGTALQKLKGFNDELVMSRVGKEEDRGHLFVIFKRTNEPSKIQEQFLLLEKLSCLAVEFTDKNDNYNILGLFNALWEVTCSSLTPFTYIFVPEGEEVLARKLIFTAN